MTESEHFKPKLSVVVIFYNMRREAARTLYTLSSSYQTILTGSDYEVIAIDNGSSCPLSEEEVSAFGLNFQYHYLENLNEADLTLQKYEYKFHHHAHQEKHISKH